MRRISALLFSDILFEFEKKNENEKTDRRLFSLMFLFSSHQSYGCSRYFSEGSRCWWCRCRCHEFSERCCRCSCHFGHWFYGFDSRRNWCCHLLDVDRTHCCHFSLTLSCSHYSSCDLEGRALEWTRSAAVFCLNFFLFNIFLPVQFRLILSEFERVLKRFLMY